MWVDHAPNPFCFDCRDAKACPVHYDSTDPAPCGHCFACNSGVACAFHALPAQQEAMALKRAGKDPDLEAAKAKKRRRKPEDAMPHLSEKDAAEVFALTETPEQAAVRIAEEYAHPERQSYRLSPELEARRQEILGMMRPDFVFKDASIAISLRANQPTPEQVARALAGKDAPELEDWTENLHVTGGKRKKLIAAYYNLVEILSKKPFWVDPQIHPLSPYRGTPGGRLCFNEMTRTVHVLLEPLDEQNKLIRGRYELEPLDEERFAWVRQTLCEVHGFDPDKLLLEQAVTDVAYHRRFHPVQRFLTALRWDGVARLDRVASEILGVAEPKDIEQVIVRKWFVSLAARAFEPGCKCDTVLVLHGEQGFFKSTFFKILGGEWFSDSPMDLSNKDCFLQLAKAWLYEWSEIGKITRKKDADEIKAFVTSSHDTYRAPYARIAEKHPRSMVFVGTTNEDEFLNDPTGDRRFWVIHVPTTVNLELLAEWREMLLAEATHLYSHGTPWHLTPDEEKARRELTQPYQREDAWHDIVRVFLDGKQGKDVTLRHVLEILGLEVKDFDPVRKQRVSDILRALGWRPIRTSGRENRARAWRRCT